MRYANPADLPLRSDAEQLDFFDSALAASEKALKQVGAIDHDLLIAGKRVRLRFAGSAMARQTMCALEPLCAPIGGDPDVLLMVWDSASTGTVMPAPQLSNLCFSQRGDLWTFRSPRIRSAFHHWDYSLNLYDRERGIGMFWVQNAASLPSWTRAAPFRTLLHWFFADQGMQMVHGAAVGIAGDGVLICGPGGVGKSTTALTALAQGMDFAGDDYVLLELTPGEHGGLQAHALYATAKVHPAEAGGFQSLGFDVAMPRSSDSAEKAVIYIGEKITRSLSIRAIVTPRFGSARETLFERYAAECVVAAASFPTRAQLPHCGAEAIAFIHQAASAVPYGRMVLGQAVEQVPGALRRLLRDPATVLPPDESPPSPPLVSVIIPAFNAGAFIGEAIESILAQSHGAVEIIVVDDGSTDDTAAVAARHGGAVRVIRQTNAGPAAARNRGLTDARGAFVAFLDADDLWPSHKIRAALLAFEDVPQAEVVLGHSQLFEIDKDNGKPIFVASPVDTFPWSIAAAMFRRSVFENVGPFDEDLRFGEDTDWFERAEHLRVNIRKIDDIGLLVRRHAANSTRGRTVQNIYPARLVHKRIVRQREARAPSSQRPMSDAHQ